MILIFVKLLLAHLIGDFLLQPNSWVADKEAKKHKSLYLYFHILLHGVLAFVIIGDCCFWPYAIVLAVSHGFIDFLKLRFQNSNTKRNWFIIDQALHVLVLALLTNFYTQEYLRFYEPEPGFWIVFTAAVLLTKPTSIIIRTIISVWTPESKGTDDNSLQNAGNYIGILERLFVLAFILTGHFEAIGFLLGAKSIFRFGDLMEAKERKLTEYVLIGTLLSFGIAMLAGLLAQYALTQTFIGLL